MTPIDQETPFSIYDTDDDGWSPDPPGWRPPPPETWTERLTRGITDLLTLIGLLTVIAAGVIGVAALADSVRPRSASGEPTIVCAIGPNDAGYDPDDTYECGPGEHDDDPDREPPGGARAFN